MFFFPEHAAKEGLFNEGMKGLFEGFEGNGKEGHFKEKQIFPRLWMKFAILGNFCTFEVAFSNFQMAVYLNARVLTESFAKEMVGIYRRVTEI